MANIADIQKQLEYYFSNANLERDKYFHEEILKDPENYLPVITILNCNKMKALKTTEENIIQAAKMSMVIELKTDNKAIRRKGKTALPELKTLKRTKRDDAKVEEDPNIITEDDNKDPHLFIIRTQAKSTTNWREIERKIKEGNPTFKLLYSRFSDCEGQLLISSVHTPKEEVAKLDKLKIVVEGAEFVLSLPTKDDTEKFWKDHGSHFQMCMSKKITIAKKKLKSMKKKVKEELNQKVKGPFVLGEITYEDINKVKSKARVILNTKKDGEELNKFETSFIKDLLKFHKKSDDKLKDLKSIIVDAHPSFKATRCFFVIRNDGNKEDFSIAKCIDDMIAEKANA